MTDDIQIPNWIAYPAIALIFVVMIYGIFKSLVDPPRQPVFTNFSNNTVLNLTPEQKQMIEDKLINEYNCTKEDDGSMYCPLLDMNRS